MEAKFCPVCGKQIVSNVDEFWGLRVACSDCACCMGTNWYPIDQWNTRPREAELERKVAELREVAERIVSLIGDDNYMFMPASIFNRRIGAIYAMARVALEATK